MVVHLQDLRQPDIATKTSILHNHNAKHYIKTSDGVTQQWYQSTPDCPSFGEVQGKASSPTNWLFHCSTPLTTLHMLYTGIIMVSVCRRKKAAHINDAYVDDTDSTYVNEEKQKKEMPLTIRDSIRKIVQTWEELLFGSGRKLYPKKTFWRLIWWIWEDGKAKMAIKQEVFISLDITFCRKLTTTTIQQINCDEPLRELGVLGNPKGDFCTEFKRHKMMSIAVSNRTKK
eukprot:2859922-Ditylum_brightwellii.AAC.1